MSSSVLSETKISTGFLTVVPKKVRKLINAKEGDLLQWSLRSNEIRIRVRHPSTVADIVGIISRGGDAVQSKKSVEGMRPRVR